MSTVDDRRPQHEPADRRHPLGLVADRPTFYFDLASPYTYLAAERTERLCAGLRWVPASSEALQCHASLTREGRATVAQRAGEIGLALSWPLTPPLKVAGAMRVASLAIEQGVGALFVLAASRLAFCGAHDIDNLQILEDAAYVAGISQHDMVQAALDSSRDEAIEHAGRRLLVAGAERLPALHVGDQLVCDEAQFGVAAAAARGGAAARGEQHEPDDPRPEPDDPRPEPVMSQPEERVVPFPRLRSVRAPS